MKNIVKQEQVIALKDFRLNTQNYIDKVAKGESFLVVKRSQPAFRLEPVEEQWETVVDFTEIKKGGVPIEMVIDRLRELKKSK